MKTSISRRLYLNTIAIAATITLFYVGGCNNNDLINSEMEPFIDRYDLDLHRSLNGTVIIRGTAEFGQRLTAVADVKNKVESIFYQWTRSDGITLDAIRDSYTVQFDDVGHTITVTVTNPDYPGSIISEPTAIVTDPHPGDGASLNEKLIWLQRNAKSDTEYNIGITRKEDTIGHRAQVLSYPGRTNVTLRLTNIGDEKSISIIRGQHDDWLGVDHSVTLILEGSITLNFRSVSVNGGTFTMMDGKLTQVSVGNNGIFEMNGGEIGYMRVINGKAVMANGKMYGPDVSDNGIFEMSGGEITGRVSVSDNGAFTMTNGKITAGGVRVKGGTFTIIGGEISGNTRVIDYGNGYGGGGGGVYVDGGGIVTMNGGKISGNTIEYNGGGVFVGENGTFIMNGGEISGNTAAAVAENSSPYSGGGVFVNRGTFTMTNGEIFGNTVAYGSGYYSHGGGGVCVASGAFTMSGGKISRNTASSGSGGGVFARGTFAITGGEISENVAYFSGGGVSFNGGVFEMTGGKISRNTASSGGGVYASFENSSFTMTDGEISKNIAFESGGGMHFHGGVIFTKTGGTIYGYTDGDDNCNVVKDSNGIVRDNRGHAVFSGSNKYRETTAGPSVNLDSTIPGSAGGWEN